MSNPLLRLQEFDQSPWFDCNLQALLASEDLKRMVEQDGLKGTSFNPSSFGKTIVGDANYAGILPQIREKICDSKEVYEAVAIGNVRLAADIRSPRRLQFTISVANSYSWASTSTFHGDKRDLAFATVARTKGPR
jgi:transaldolase / glucose-6-phosphate isomerase